MKLTSVSAAATRAFFSSSVTSSSSPSSRARTWLPRKRHLRPCLHSPVLWKTGQIVVGSRELFRGSPSSNISTSGMRTNGGTSVMSSGDGKWMSRGFAAWYAETSCVKRHLSSREFGSHMEATGGMGRTLHRSHTVSHSRPGNTTRPRRAPSGTASPCSRLVCSCAPPSRAFSAARRTVSFLPPPHRPHSHPRQVCRSHGSCCLPPRRHRGPHAGGQRAKTCTGPIVNSTWMIASPCSTHSGFIGAVPGGRVELAIAHGLKYQLERVKKTTTMFMYNFKKVEVQYIHTSRSWSDKIRLSSSPGQRSAGQALALHSHLDQDLDHPVLSGSWICGLRCY